MKKKTLAAASLLLALLMPLGATPLAVYAEEGEGTTQSETSNENAVSAGTPPSAEVLGSQIWNSRDKSLSKTLEEATKNAQSGDTLYLGEGHFTLYGVPSDNTTKGKDLTFVGQNPDKTFWDIGTPTLDQSGEPNGDYSFDGAEKVTFKDMTLLASVTPEGKKETRNYTGFIRPNHTVVEDCVIDGMTFYWGYVSAEFKHTKFICGQTKYAYALWTYSSPLETFDHCTFDASANPERSSVIYVHNDGSDKLFTINFKDCNVIAPQGINYDSPKQVLCIKDSNPQKFTINISGNNIISGDVPVDSTTCSRLFGFGGNEGNNNSNTTVTINGLTVWQNGARIVEHNGNNFDGSTYVNGTDSGNANQYTEGYKDGKVYNDYGKWSDWTEDATVPHLFRRTRTVTEKCHYCNYSKSLDPETETKQAFLLRYDLNGGTEAEGVDYRDRYYFEPTDGNKATVAAAPSRAGYQFAGWQDKDGNPYAAGDTVTVNHDITLTAQWNKLVTVSFDLCGHGGANISSQTFVSGNKASEPTAPKEDGWVFGGWYTEKGCKYRFSFDSAVTSDITLYAKWDRVTTVVSAPVATPTPSPAPAAAATKTATVKNAAIPQTSDAFPMEGLLALLAVGAVGFGAAGWLRKKHH